VREGAADHGRIETRTATVSTDIGWLQEDHHWPGLTAVGKVVRVRETSDKTTTETAYYLISTALPSERFGEVVRFHWGVENCLHWRLDVVMNEDQARHRQGEGAHNLAVLRDRRETGGARADRVVLLLFFGPGGEAWSGY
jgi:predicted transposase YbfD/YdcC